MSMLNNDKRQKQKIYVLAMEPWTSASIGFNSTIVPPSRGLLLHTLESFIASQKGGSNF